MVVGAYLSIHCSYGGDVDVGVDVDVDVDAFVVVLVGDLRSVMIISSSNHDVSESVDDLEIAG